MTREIGLNGAKGGVALVDDEDYERLSQYRWHQGAKGYVESSFRVQGKTTTIRMHRLILDAPKGMEIDHWNRNKLDNQRSNLRVVTPSVNQWNVGARVENVTGYLGVNTVPTAGRWVAVIMIRGKKMHLGTFDSPLAAHEAHLAACALREATGSLDGWVKPTQPRRPRGSANHASRLTNEQVREIRLLAAQPGVSLSAIARTFGVTPPAIIAIVKRETWAWLD